MLLTVHNLPLSITYAELKTLIYNKCGISDTILDHLVNEGSTKKVTIGVADEGDAAILVRKINGLFLNGQHLYVEDVRKQRGSEQPYRSNSTSNNQRPYYQTVPGYDGMTGNQNVNVMGQQPPVDNYNISQMNYYTSSDQNISPMGYNSQNQSFATKQTPYLDPEQSYGYETQRVEDTYKNVPQVRNSRRDPQPQRSQGREQHFPKTSRWVLGNPVRENEIRKRSPPRESWNARDEQDSFRAPNDNYRDQQNSFRPSNDNYRDQQNAYRPPNDNYREQQKAFRPSNDNYHDKLNTFAPSDDDYRDQQNAYAPLNDSYRNQQDYVRLPNNDRGSTQDNVVRNYKQQVSYDTGYSAPIKEGGAFDRMEMNPYESEIYGNHVTELQVRDSAPIQWNKKEEVQTRRFSSSNQLDFGPISIPSKNDADHFVTGSGFRKNSREVGVSHYQSSFPSNRFDNTSVSQFGGSVSSIKSFENKSGQPTSSRSADKFHYFKKPSNDRNSFKQSEGKPFERESRKRPYNADDRNSGLQKKKYDSETRQVEPIKSFEPKINKDKESNISKEINKDQTWRGQAASKIAKQMMQKYWKGTSNQRLLNQLKMSIRTRIDVLLGELFLVPCDEIVDLYRKRFRFKNDKAFYHAVLKIVEDVQNKDKKLVENASIQNLADKAEDKTPNKPETSTANVSTTNATTKPSPSADAPTKQQTVKKGPKVPNLTLNQNISGKAIGKAQKKTAKLEYKGEQVYTLPYSLQKALDEEVNTLVDIFKKQCQNPEDSSERTVCKKITEIVSEDFKMVVSLNVTKRILDVRTGLALRVIGVPKPPKKASLLEFLSFYGGIVVNKSEAKNMFIATVDSYENYDELCAMGTVVIDDVTVKFCPIHIAGPPQKITRAEIMEKRNKWIQNQIDKSSGNEDKSEQSNSKVTQAKDAENSESVAKTDDTDPQKEDKDDKAGEIVEDVVGTIDEECIIIEDDDTNNVLDVDNAVDQTETTTDEAKLEDISELLEAELDEDDLEDY